MSPKPGPIKRSFELSEFLPLLLLLITILTLEETFCKLLSWDYDEKLVQPSCLSSQIFNTFSFAILGNIPWFPI